MLERVMRQSILLCNISVFKLCIQASQLADSLHDLYSSKAEKPTSVAVRTSHGSAFSLKEHALLLVNERRAVLSRVSTVHQAVNMG